MSRAVAAAALATDTLGHHRFDDVCVCCGKTRKDKERTAPELSSDQVSRPPPVRPDACRGVVCVQ